MKSRPGLATLGVIAVSIAIFAGPILGEPGGSLRPLHGTHAENDIGCADCHTTAAGSTSGMDDLRPSKSLCSDCHDVDAPDECATCHVDGIEPAGYSEVLPLAGRFPHATHLAAEMDCNDCHAVEGSVEPVRPEMALCRNCHETTSAMSDCGLCHMPTETLLPGSHAPEWLSYHGIEAGWDDESCAACHTKTDCQDCHSGDNVRPRSHRLNFAFDHALEARANELLCASCHDDSGFCADCHTLEQVLPQDHSRVDWLLGADGGRHSEEARFNIETCIACHDSGSDEPTCARCHGR